MRIAIVGAGVSGLVAAHPLHDRHEICVFEAATRPGGHANTVDVDIDGATHRARCGAVAGASALLSVAVGAPLDR